MYFRLNVFYYQNLLNVLVELRGKMCLYVER